MRCTYKSRKKMNNFELSILLKKSFLEIFKLNRYWNNDMEECCHQVRQIILCQNPRIPTLNATHFSLVVQIRRPDKGSFFFFFFYKICIDFYKTLIKKYTLALERFIWLQTTCKNQFRIKNLKCCYMFQWDSLLPNENLH